jgi:hypothetical protein
MQITKNLLAKGSVVLIVATALFGFTNFPLSNSSYSLSPAGDVNGDGYADVMVSVFTSEYGVSKDGKVQLYLGTGNGLGAQPVWNSEGKGGTNFGESISNAGDLNGDGYFDVIVGASRYTNGQANEGAAFVYYGSPEGLQSAPGWSMEGDQANAYFGVSVSTAGDVNRDGYADVIIGANYYDNGEANEGRAFIFLGSPNGLSKTPYFIAESNQVNAFFGKSVASAGDVNRDGYGDVIIGAPGYDNGQVNEGRAYLYLGTYMGMTQSAAWTGESNQAEANYGNSVASAGDVNGDGFADVVIGANRYDEGMSNVGKIYLHLGSTNGFSLYSDWSFTGNKLDGNLGISLASAGDVNGDGFGELLVGSYGYDPQDPKGDVFVFYGSRRGTMNDYVMIDKNKYPGGLFGMSVASAGDINGDGYADILAGMMPNAGQSWKLMLVKGSSKGLVQGQALP